eukprot:724426-Pleurochrysis_carterae.AAC.1
MGWAGSVVYATRREEVAELLRQEFPRVVAMQCSNDVCGLILRLFSRAEKEAMKRRTWAGSSAMFFRNCTALKRVWSSTRTS